MPEDDVMKEVRRIKEEHAAKYGYDVHAIAEALRENQRQGHRKVVSRPPKRPASA